MAKFTVEYVGKVKRRLEKLDKKFLDGYRVEVEGEFGTPPVLDVVRYLADFDSGTLSTDDRARLTKQMVLGKPLSFYYRGSKVGGFVMNSEADLFDAYEVFVRHPPILMLLMQVCLMRLVEKSMPLPEESDPPAAAGETPGSRQPSPER